MSGKRRGKGMRRSFEAPEQAAEALEEFGSQAAFYQFDITDTDHAGDW